MDKSGPGGPNAAEAEIVVVIDDDAGVRSALRSLLRSAGFQIETFASVAAFMNPPPAAQVGCLILDVRLPDISGLDFQAEIDRLRMNLPIVFMTGHGDIPMTVKAMRAGAIDFLAKPFLDQEMLDAVAKALAHSRRVREEERGIAEQRRRFETLSPREREIMAHVVTGLMNKQIAHVVGLSEITVKIHRGNVMRKMNVRSLPDLVRASQVLGPERPSADPDQSTPEARPVTRDTSV